MLLSLIATIAILRLAIATHVSPPILYSRHGSQSQHGSLSGLSLEKRADCGDGTQCLLGSCCGDGCAMTCCALDNGGLGCGIAERCQFHGNVFVGCCGNFLGGCTGEATRVTVHTPYSTVTLGGTTTDAMTEVSTTATAISTSSTTEETFTAISISTATATATRTTTSSETESESSSHSHRAASSSTSMSVTGRTTDRSPRLTGGFVQTTPSPSPSPNPNGGFSVGVGVPVLAGVVVLGAVLL